MRHTEHVNDEVSVAFAHKGMRLGFTVNAGLDDDGRPYVTVSTENMPPRFTYDEATGLLGDQRPFTYEEQDDGTAVVYEPGGEVVARHYGNNSATARIAAREHAEHLNDGWAKRCGMPIISVHLNDATLYDAVDHNPALRATEEAAP